MSLGVSFTLIWKFLNPMSLEGHVIDDVLDVLEKKYTFPALKNVFKKVAFKKTSKDDIFNKIVFFRRRFVPWVSLSYDSGNDFHLIANREDMVFVKHPVYFIKRIIEISKFIINPLGGFSRLQDF